MRRFTTLFIFLLLLSFTISAQGIFDADIHTAEPIGEVNSPAAEGPQNIIDQDPATKFLDFNNFDGISFQVDIGAANAVVAKSFSITVANDAPERDPVDYEIFGSNDGDDFESITDGSVPCVNQRLFTRTFQFENDEAYSIYRVEFFGTCNPTDINQIADIQLFSLIGTAPEITCPASMTFDSDPGDCSAIVDYIIAATDVEDGDLTAQLNIGLPSGTAFPVGTTPIVYSVTDADGNQVSCDFEITIEDNENPVFACPESSTVILEPNTTETIIDYTVTISDNCALINQIPGFTPLGNINGQAFYVSDTGFTAQAAIANATFYGGFVGTIRREEDNEYLVNALARNNVLDGVLIGLTDSLEEDEFVWLTPDPVDFENWNENEPNNSGAGGVDEDYTIILSNGRWNDVANNVFFRYLLQVEYTLPQLEGLASGEVFGLGETINTFVASDLYGNEMTCSFTVTVDNNSNTENPRLANGIKLVPNPASDYLTIANESGIDLTDISIYDAFGRLVLSQKINGPANQQLVNVTGLPSGLYLIRMEGDEGGTTKKLVIE